MQSKNISKKTLYIIDLIIFFVLAFLDQLSKFFAVKRIKGHPSYSFIKGFLEFTYIENSGAAFGLLRNEKAFFVFFDAVVFSLIIYVIIRCPGKLRFLHMNVFFSIIMAGALGNLMDRFIYGSVVDFIYFSSLDLPVFNMADIFITIGTVFVIIFLVFYYKEDDLNFLRFKEKKLREIN